MATASDGSVSGVLSHGLDATLVGDVSGESAGGKKLAYGEDWYILSASTSSIRQLPTLTPTVERDAFLPELGGRMA